MAPTATRTLPDDKPTPGTTTTVTVEVSGTDDPVTLVETFSPPVADATVLTDAPFAAVQDDGGALALTVPAAGSLSYEVTLPPDGQAHAVDGTLDVAGGPETTVGGDGSIEPDGLAPVVGDTPPTNVIEDGAGLYEDIDGDGEFTIFDVQALFRNLDSPAVQNFPAAFNFAGDDSESVGIADVQGLFERLVDGPD